MECGDSSPLWEFLDQRPKTPKAATSRRTPYLKTTGLEDSACPTTDKRAAAVPQIIQGPYFQTFIDALNVEKSDKHYFVSFAYGNRLNPELKKAVMDAIPSNRLENGRERGGR